MCCCITPPHPPPCQLCRHDRRGAHTGRRRPVCLQHLLRQQRLPRAVRCGWGAPQLRRRGRLGGVHHMCGKLHLRTGWHHLRPSARHLAGWRRVHQQRLLRQWCLRRWLLLRPVNQQLQHLWLRREVHPVQRKLLHEQRAVSALPGCLHCRRGLLVRALWERGLLCWKLPL